ncbi:sugar ABC transporter permease [Streptomyces sp. NPDC001380]|uniref:sugar ABC transporter permease n=1 Tax=Streptomyces sp. NPDC001380 TaxID=3364566 RepID=UPI0036C25F98
MSTTADLPVTGAPDHEPAPTAGTAKPRRHRGRGQRSRGQTALLHTLLGIASLVAFFPVAWIVYVSLGPDKSDYLHPDKIAGKISFSNYSDVLQNTDFLKWFGNSVLIALSATLIGVLLSASAGYAVSRMKFPGHRPLMWTFLITQMFPVAILIVPLYNILAGLNLLDTYQGLVIVYLTTAIPYCAWLMKGYFDTIPVEIDEAGRVDGLSPFGTFWKLVLPLARPGLAVAAFYSFLTAWGEVAYATQFLLSSEKYTLAVGLQTFVSEHDAQWNLMAATSVMIALPAALFFYLVQRHLVTGLTAGASKS